MNLYPASGSRKLTGMVIVLAALILVLFVFLVASAVLAVTGHPGALDWTPCRDTMAFLTGNGFFQQISQGASDVSKWRNQPSPPPPSVRVP